ncbi:MAG: response regulator [Spartobacteria bacterium]|nr:response regulator [Spartobacteria bacterium]
MKRVLIIEDDELVQKLIATLVRRLDAEPVIADSPETVENAIEQIETMSCAIVDLILPFETGWDIIDRIRKAGEAGTALPVVVFTGALISETEQNRLLEKVECIQRKNDFTIDGFTDLLRKWI